MKNAGSGDEQELRHEGQRHQPEDRPQAAPEPGRRHAAEQKAGQGGGAVDGQGGEGVAREERDRQGGDGDDLGARVEAVQGRVGGVVLGDRALHASASAAAAAVLGAAPAGLPSRCQSSTKKGTSSRCSRRTVAPAVVFEAPRTGRHELAAGQHEPFVAERPRLVDVVSRQDDAAALPLQPLQHGGEVAPAGRVEAHEGLVEQEQARAHGQYAGEREAALLPSGERVGMPPAEGRLGQADQLESARDGRVDLARRPAELARPEGDVVGGRGREELQLRGLKDEADLTLARAVVLVGRSSAAERHAPGVGSEQPADELQQGRLSGARRPEQGDRGAGGDGEADLAHGRHPPPSLVVGEREPFADDVEPRRHRAATPHRTTPRRARRA